MPALIIVLFFTGMFILAFLVIVVETVWVVATVGIIHMVGSLVLMALIMRSLHQEERDTAEREAREENGFAAPSPRT